MLAHNCLPDSDAPKDTSMVRSLSFAFVGLAALAAALFASAAGADTWLTYQNDRYGTTIDYPEIFKMQRPPDADDGRTFKSADGADFTVFALYNTLDFTVATYR